MLVAGGLLSGCVSIPHEQPQLKAANAASMGLSAAAGALPPQPAAAYPSTATPVVVPAGQVTVAPDWWRAMHDPQLDRIMDDAFAGSPTLAEAEARLRIAGSILSMEKGALLPQVTADASVQRQRFSASYIYPPPFGGSWNWISSASVNLDWSLDLAGRQKAMIAAVRAATQAQALDAAAARVTLSGAVAEAYVNLTRADRQSRIAREFVASREQTQALTQTRKHDQLASDIDLRSAETLLAEARQAEVRAEGNRQLMIHAIAALAGRGADYYADIGAPTLDPESALPVPATLPSDLLARRPDILAARANVESARAGIRISRAAFYPDIDIKAFIGASALGVGSLFSQHAMEGGAGPALHLPIFEGGALKARYRASVAGADMSIAQYNQTVLTAVKQAADALSSVETARRDAEQQAAIVTGLEQSVELDHVRLANGLSSRFDVIAAGQRLLTAREAQTDIIADGLLRRIQLLVALGGGFSPITGTRAPREVALSAQRQVP